MKQQILTIAAAALLSIPSLSVAEDKPAGDKPPGGGDRPPGENRGPGGPGGRGGRPGNPEERLKMMTEKLGLTQEQQDKIKAIYAKNADAFKAAREKGKDMTEEERTKMRETMKAQMDEINEVLTPEQKEKMKELRPRGDGPRGNGDKPGDKQ